MPITISARKKVRQDKKRREINLKSLNLLKRVLKKARKKPSLANVQEAGSVIDRVAKKRLIHKNKASRLKSQLAKKVISQKSLKKTKK
ncbi:MAG: 30S ribosomal protein S20 [Patescibacteria group bacterium]|nr:30S ribosomal protein S20 [Patescibacteria group bacterium]